MITYTQLGVLLERLNKLGQHRRLKAVVFNLFLFAYHLEQYFCRCEPPNAQPGGKKKTLLLWAVTSSGGAPVQTSIMEPPFFLYFSQHRNH